MATSNKVNKCSRKHLCCAENLGVCVLVGECGVKAVYFICTRFGWGHRRTSVDNRPCSSCIDLANLRNDNHHYSGLFKVPNDDKFVAYILSHSIMVSAACVQTCAWVCVFCTRFGWGCCLYSVDWYPCSLCIDLANLRNDNHHYSGLLYSAERRQIRSVHPIA